MFVAIVFVEVKKENLEDYKRAIMANATASVRDEPGCHRFDVSQDPEDELMFCLYEVYENEAAFKDHQQTKHFRLFDTTASTWVHDQDLLTYTMLQPTA